MPITFSSSHSGNTYIKRRTIKALCWETEETQTQIRCGLKNPQTKWEGEKDTPSFQKASNTQ